MLQTAVKQHPRSARLHKLLATLEFKRENLAVLNLRAGTIELERGRLPEAEEWLRRAVALDPDQAFDHFELGRCLLKEAKHDAAEVEFRQAIRLDPKLIRTHFFLAQTFQAQGKKEEAQREFKLFSDLLARHRSTQTGASATSD